MKITLKVIGRDLFTMLNEQLGKLNTAFPRFSAQVEHFEWEIIEIRSVRPEHLLSYPDTPSALLIDAQEPAYIEKIQLLEKKELTFIKDPPFLPIVMSPIVLIFRSHTVLADAPDFPDFVADWICTPFLITDLARRVISSLRRKNILKTKLHFGSLSLVPDLRVLSY